MSRESDIKRLIQNHNRRLQKLKEQDALSPNVDRALEIEDVEVKLEQLQTELKALTNETILMQPVIIYLPDPISSLTPERQSAIIDALAGLLRISNDAIKVYRVYEGSTILELEIPSAAIQTLRSLLETNNAKLRLLKIEKIILQGELGEAEEWVVKDGKFSLTSSTDSKEHDNSQKQP